MRDLLARCGGRGAESCRQRCRRDLVSLMDHTPGQRQFRDLEKLLIYYRGKSGS